MAKYIIKVSCDGYSSISEFKKSFDTTGKIVESYALKVGTLCVRDDASTTWKVDAGGKSYKVWKIKFNGKWAFVNSDYVVPLKKYYIKSNMTFRKDKNGKTLSRYSDIDKDGGWTSIPKGTLVYLLEKSFKSNKGLNKTWIVSDKRAGYFYGKELTTTNPKDPKKNSDKKNNKDNFFFIKTFSFMDIFSILYARGF